MRQQLEAPARWVTVCIAQASVWFYDFPGEADMFVVCGRVIFSLDAGWCKSSAITFL